jgi:methionyl-tRNA formyltransferase
VTADQRKRGRTRSQRQRERPSATPRLRVAFLGTSEFAVKVLAALAASPAHRPVIAVTPPDRPRGRGRRITSPPVAAAARELGIDLHQTEGVNIDASRAAVAAAGAEVGFVCAFGQLIREPLLSELELWNVHPSLLPRWRGAAPIEWAILAGDRRTGVSIARVTAGLDSGPVALRSEVAIAPDDDYGSLSERLASLAGRLAVDALERRAAGGLAGIEQDDAAATYAKKIEPGERRLDPSRPAAELERLVRALTPHIGAYLELAEGERLSVRRATVADGSLPPGELVAARDAILLGCSPGALALRVVKPAGRREMTSAEFLRGHALPRLAAAPR